MTDVEPAEDVEAPEGGTTEKAEGATGTGVLEVAQYGVEGYVTDEGAVAGIFWWNDPTYPANGDSIETYQAQLEAGQAEEERRAGGGDDVDQQRELEPA
jgi:hypothetical protein